MSQNDDQRDSLQQSQERIQEKKNSIARSVGEKFIKSAGKKGAKNVLSQKTMGMLLKFAPALGYVLLVLLIIFIIGGLIAFFLTMPGLMMEKINKTLNNIVTTIKSFYGSTVDAHTSDEDIIELAKYIENMDYDLIGYGFIKPIVNDNIKLSEELIQDGYKRVVDTKDDDDSSNDVVYYKNESGEIYDGYFYDIDGKLYHGNKGIASIDEKNIVGSKAQSEKNSAILKNGIIYDSRGEKVIGFDKNKVDYSRLKTYALSNNRIYILRNSDTTFFATIVKGITKILTGYQGSWAMGMLEIYTAENGEARHLYDVWDKVKDGFATVEITGDNPENYRLKLKAGFLNNPMLFELDEWSSRYGLSSDFLISLHLATLSPELIETMCQTFDIRAQVYLDHITGANIKAYFYTKQMEEAGKEPAYYENMKKAKQDSKLNPFDALFLSKKEAKEIMDHFGIESLTSGKYTCGGKDPSIVWDYRQYSNEGTSTNMCFTEAMDGDTINWVKDIIYNQWSDEKSMWTGDRNNTGKGGTLIYVEKVIFDSVEEKEKNWSSKKDDFEKFLTNGNNRPGIIYAEDDEYVYYKNFPDNDGWGHEIKLKSFLNILESIENTYKRVEDGVYDCNIVETETKVDLSGLRYKFFDKYSELWIENLMPYTDLKNMGKDNTGYYEVVLNVWPTNDSGLKDGDPGYNSEEDGELVLSLLFRHTTVDNNYNASWILYENLSLARMKEERI